MDLIPVPGIPQMPQNTKPVWHNYRAYALEPGSHNYWNPCTLEPMLRNESSPCSPQVDKNLHSNEDPAKPKKKPPQIPASVFLCVKWE